MLRYRMLRMPGMPLPERYLSGVPVSPLWNRKDQEQDFIETEPAQVFGNRSLHILHEIEKCFHISLASFLSPVGLF
ncbi:MAG: hypothetical protein BWY93_00002 [Euryarchaeota archaeon ADurb.BinA087]|nr:MAG: hypothetical protein BWY93_00002 [Euryarchaeota archaeon ADurb.BinA087]